ncbi:MFS transporter [Rathayibacter sp. AY1F3]|uniref:MFS transporter n=1 Tax=Rathayibacter sp. AY1F3 TaxID=2080558 RepID=UPI000CE84A22|nr:MFS transporter [Rathayibacter sp. AY1F3]PPG92853.1 MFS transporter [Rathayibacter sp. AY1F3]
MTPHTNKIALGPAGTARALLLLCAAQFVLQLDFSVVNVALPSIRSGLGFTGSSLQWIVTGYALTFGALLLLGGRAGDLYGQRRVLMLGLALFGVASISAGLAPTPELLITSRIIQGAGGALVAPAALSSLTLLFPDGPARVHALGIWQGATAAGGTAGIVLGGFLVELIGWRSIFLINIPIVAILLVAVPLTLPRRRPQGARGSLHVGPSLLITAAIATVIFGLSNLEQYGILDPLTLGPVVLGVVLAAVFVMMQARAHDPLIPVSVLASTARRGALGAMLVTGAVLAAYVYFVSLYLQTVLDFDPLLTGIGLLPATVTIVVVSSVITRRIIARYGLRSVALSGGILVAAGQSAFAFVSTTGSYAVNILPGLLLTALGIGLLLPALSIAATARVDASVQGEAASLLTTAQQIGAALGVATLATIAASSTAGGASVAGGFATAFTVSAIAMIAVAILIGITFRIKAPAPASTGAAPAAESVAVDERVQR